MNEECKIRLDKFKLVYGPALLVSFIWLIFVFIFSDFYLVEAYLHKKSIYSTAYCDHMLALATLLTQISCVSLDILDYCSSVNEQKKWFILIFLLVEGTFVFFNYRVASLCKSSEIDDYKFISINTAYVCHGLFLFFLWLCKFFTEVHNNDIKILVTTSRANGIRKKRNNNE